MATTQATLPLLHRFLGIGLTALAAVAVVLKYFGAVPLLGDERFPLVAYALSGIGAAMAAVALLLFRPRVPPRPPEQSVEHYWLTPDVVQKILPVWFLLEGAGVMAVVGYLITGEPVSAIAAGLAIVTFWLCGPALFTKA